jgi:hypothetical protein
MRTRNRIRDGPGTPQLSLIGPVIAVTKQEKTHSTVSNAAHSASSDERSEQQLLLAFPGDAQDAEYVWTDEDISILREEVLRDALCAVLDGRNGEAQRRELWEWIDNDQLLPFSFRACAAAVGVDPNELRAALKRMVARATKGATV